jgi:L-alanine-DL-glutamate epimerase-like enolase superfamily enzyme
MTGSPPNEAVDIVRADVSWKGGVTGTMRVAHLAEAAGLQCEIHTAIHHGLDLVNLHCCCAISNSTYF